MIRTNNDLENLLASTQVATIFLDEQGNIQRFTPAVTEIYNLIPGDIGRPLSHITHRAISMPLLPAGEAWAEEEIETENGKWFIRRVQPYRNVEGRPQGLVVTFVDVSALKWAQASLRERETRLALALDAGGMGTWEWDLQTDTVRCDERMLSLFDLGLIEQTLCSQALFDQVHPDDLESMRESLRQAIEGDGSYITEFRIVLKDGSIRWLAGRGRVLRDDAGRPVRIHGVNFDISGRKHDEENLQRSENQFRALAESIPQLAWMAEPDGHIFWYNKRWFDFTGTTLESMQGWGWQSVHDPDHLPEVMERWRTSLEQGVPFEMAFPLRGADGRFRTFLTRVLPVKNEQGAVVRWFGTNTDIETQKQAEEDLKRASRHKDEFLAMLAHELRNPLSPIRNAVHLLKFAAPSDPTLAGARDMIDRQVTHLVRLVDDLLDVSRITRGKIELRQELVDLDVIVESAVESARPLIDARRHHLEISLPSEPVVVVADPTRLAQVVLNLLNNSAKYTADQGRIRLSVERQDDQAVIRVRDNGMGIAPELLPRVFELFTQAERTLDRSQGGLGIGLTIVRRLVEMQGGSVEAHSEGPGRGCEFVVKLPVAATQQNSPKLLADARTSRPKAQGMRVLVVDDHADSADSLSLLLVHLGHEVQTAYEGKTALAMAREFRPRFVFCDLGLPVMDGYEVARRLRSLPETRGSVLVALTGYGQEEDKKRSVTAGFHYHLVKPVSPRSLEDLLGLQSTNGDVQESVME